MTDDRKDWDAEKRWNRHDPLALLSWLRVNLFNEALVHMQWDDLPPQVQRRYEMDSRP